MLVEAGCKYVIVGHSERRQLFRESDDNVAKKSLMALSAGLTPIVCVGETDEERTNGLEKEVLERQFDQRPRCVDPRRILPYPVGIRASLGDWDGKSGDA